MRNMRSLLMLSKLLKKIKTLFVKPKREPLTDEQINEIAEMLSKVYGTGLKTATLIQPNGETKLLVDNRDDKDLN